MFCRECGEQLVNEKSAICVKCGIKKGQGHNYCPECGKSVPSPNAEVCLSCGIKLKNVIDSLMGSTKSKVVAALLAFFLGCLGIHRFYLGYATIGIIQLVLCLLGFLTCGITTIIVEIWVIVDLVLILTGKLNDASGEVLN